MIVVYVNEQGWLNPYEDQFVFKGTTIPIVDSTLDKAKYFLLNKAMQYENSEEIISLWNRTYETGDREVIELFRTLLEDKHGADWSRVENMLPANAESKGSEDVK